MVIIMSNENSIIPDVGLLDDLKDMLSNIKENPQHDRFFRDVLGVDTARLLSDGEINKEEFIEVAANTGNSMLKHGFIDQPEAEEVEEVLRQAETDGVNMDTTDAIGIAAVNKMANVEVYAAISKSMDLYCEQTGETNGICSKFGDQANQPMVEERDMITGEAVEIESPIIHNPDDLLQKGPVVDAAIIHGM